MERFPLGSVQCSHCLPGIVGLGYRPLLNDHTAASLSIQPAKRRPFPSWQFGRNLLKSHGCSSLSEVWRKRSVSLVTLPSSNLSLSSLTPPSSLVSRLHEHFFRL